MMVHPGASGFGKVRRVAVHRSLFTGSGGGGNGKEGVEANLGWFWERIKGKFTGVEEVVFVERGEDALVVGEGKEGWGVQGWRVECESCVTLEGVGYGDEGQDVECWEEERFEVKVERVVRGLERETGWVAPRWRVLGRQCETQLEGERQATKEKEDALVIKMREMFGHEDVSNTF
jgi:hypothetical protein